MSVFFAMEDMSIKSGSKEEMIDKISGSKEDIFDVDDLLDVFVGEEDVLSFTRFRR
jgi:hypothetical protein